MKLRTLLGGAVAGAGAVVVANRALRAPGLPEPFDRELATYRWRGFDVAYTEAGDPDAPDLVLLHGINAAGSSHEFSQVFEALAADYHVLAPDLPGFGHSDRPPLVYSGSLYTTFIGEFLRDVAEDPLVVASSLTGAYAAVAAGDAGVGELVLVCPTATSVPGRRVWLRELVRAPVVGEALFNVLVSRLSIRRFLDDHGFDDPGAIPPGWIDYDYATAHQPGARYAAASFVSGFLDPDADLGVVLADLDVPVTLVWGREASITPLSDGRELAERANARLVVFDAADLLPHAEHPDAFVDVVRGDVPETARS